MYQLATLLFLLPRAFAAPASQEPFNTIIPGESDLYNNYRGKAPPFPGNITDALLPTSHNAPAPDDLLWQNLLAAEWIIYSFYQQGVERFNASDFTAAGFPNTTFDRLAEIRDNEAGHLNIFYNEISNASVKPGPCKYNYGFTNPAEYLAVQLLLEISSMVFTTGLVQEAKVKGDRGAIAGIAESETRHNTWALIDIWKQNPFGGPIETVYPYAHQFYWLTTAFIVNGSCPHNNPAYPSPVQKIPFLTFDGSKSNGHPGDEIEFVFSGVKQHFSPNKKYYVVYFHGVDKITVPYDPVKNTSRIPKQFEANKGVILAAITDAPGAPTAESVVAGPAILLQQPASLTKAV